MAGRSWAAAGLFRAAIAAASKTSMWRMILPFCLWARLARFPRQIHDGPKLTRSRAASQARAGGAMGRCLPLLALLAFAGAAAAQDLDRAAEYRQSAAVLARYPDVPIALDTPALKPGRDAFTSQAEMEAYLAALKARVPGLVLGSLGRSAQGRDIPYLVFTKEGLTDAAATAALGRPILWFIGLQHGNEPAGGEAMLALAARLAAGPLHAYLDRVTVVVVPRANPDGAAAFTRSTGSGADLNRDHMLLSLPESIALHTKLMELPPDVVIDAHEFSVAN